MIVRLTKRQVIDNYDLIELAIQNSFPPTAEEAEPEEIIERAVAGDIDVWTMFEQEGPEDTPRYHVIATTRVNNDIGGVKSLMIYTLASISETVPTELWIEGMDTLKAYAKSLGCKTIYGFTCVPRIVEIAKELGGNTSFTIVSFKV